MHLACVQRDGTVFKFNPHAAFDDDEHLVGVAVVVPDKLALNFDEFELIVVHFGDDFGRPVVRKEVEFFGEVDGGHGVSRPPALLCSMHLKRGRPTTVLPCEVENMTVHGGHVFFCALNHRQVSRFHEPRELGPRTFGENREWKPKQGRSVDGKEQ